MKTEKLDDGIILVSMSVEERNIISNCMNYICQGRVPKDFHALVGADVDEAIELLHSLLSVD